MIENAWEICRDRRQEKTDVATYFGGGMTKEGTVDAGMESEIFTLTKTVADFVHDVGKQMKKVRVDNRK